MPQCDHYSLLKFKHTKISLLQHVWSDWQQRKTLSLLLPTADSLYSLLPILSFPKAEIGILSSFQTIYNVNLVSLVEWKIIREGKNKMADICSHSIFFSFWGLQHLRKPNIFAQQLSLLCKMLTLKSMPTWTVVLRNSQVTMGNVWST